MARLLALAALSMVLATPLAADQTDQRLDTLFRVLRHTEDPIQAAFAQRRIWSIWFEHEDPRVRTLLAEGEEALAAGRYPAAVERFSAVVRRAPDFAEGWNRRATAYYAMGRYRDSLDDVAEVMVLEPRHFGALSGRGLCLQALGRVVDAMAAYEAALEINPHLDGIRERLKALRADSIQT